MLATWTDFNTLNGDSDRIEQYDGQTREAAGAYAVWDMLKMALDGGKESVNTILSIFTVDDILFATARITRYEEGEEGGKGTIEVTKYALKRRSQLFYYDVSWSNERREYVVVCLARNEELFHDQFVFAFPHT